MISLGHHFQVIDQEKDIYLVRFQKTHSNLPIRNFQLGNNGWMSAIKAEELENMSPIQIMRMKRDYGDTVVLLQVEVADKVSSAGEYLFLPKHVIDSVIIGSAITFPY